MTKTLVIPFFLLLSTLFLNVEVQEEDEFINPIRFPFGGPFMGIFVAISFPLGLKEEDISLSFNVEANYVLPENQTTLLYPPIYGERAITRMTAFNFIQSKLSEYGYPGYPCLLRMICDMAVHPIRFSNGVLGDLLYILLTPSSSFEIGLPPDYETAEKYGLENGHCKNYTKICSDSIVDFFSSVFSVGRDDAEIGGK
ncbi:hypothetical protein WA026_010537 [Henosepilachna vigintioctopunctata]|uniref:Uncharacterized protein n=1 Tax=Henosepilachna vigintioctopunctata TaxID=420089 RepID=A0AAW1VBT2_9CUCU